MADSLAFTLACLVVLSALGLASTLVMIPGAAAGARHSIGGDDPYSNISSPGWRALTAFGRGRPVFGCRGFAKFGPLGVTSVST
jgi:hypothetical protein